MAAEFVQRGRLFVEQGQLQEAVRVCRLGLLASPNDIEGRLVLGAALLALSRLDEVLAEVGSALNLSPNNPSALALKGDALLRKGDAQQAIEVLNRAAAASPGDPYVEGLQAAAQSANVRGLQPSETIDIDPGLISGLGDVPPEFITDSAIEILDEDSFDEATRVGSSGSGPMTLPSDGRIEQPFADTYNSGKFSSDALPMVAPMSVRSPSSPGVPNAGIPSPGAPNAGIPGPSVPNAGIPSPSVPNAGIPSPSVPNAGIPSAGAPNAGYPNPIVPNAGIPSAGAPNAGYP
ncbi:MAG: tetratricopeptide repeat protein, partial [Kofleriaceae bacterium]|nr:tetratricopeptide repeat protein [Kofleriaceae bacterium]